MSPLDCNGNAFDAEQLLREHRHRAYLYATSAKGDIASNPANRILLPPEKGISIKARLLKLAPGVRKQVLESHGIPEEAFSALKRGDDEAFIMLRAERLAQL